jgi:hypothetical protein
MRQMNVARIINPGVPWWTAIICNGIAALALALLIIDPDGNLYLAVQLLAIGAVALYGTALIRWWFMRHALPSIDLTGITIPASVFEMVPESVAREFSIIALERHKGALKIVMSKPPDRATTQKLRFILNKEIQPVLAPHEQIVAAINRHYGATYIRHVSRLPIRDDWQV